MSASSLPTHRAVRVLGAKRRGSSWPVFVETDGGPFLTKLRGAGQGPSALVAELIVAALAETLGLRVPRRVLVSVDETVEYADPDPELVHLVTASRGVNLGFVILEGATDLRVEDLGRISGDDASIVMWLDGLVMNSDRTVANPNLLVRRRELWLIDHGAALPFHHDWRRVTEDSPRRTLPDSAPHVLLGRAAERAEWDTVLAAALDRDLLRAAVEAVPDELLSPLLVGGATPSALARRREAYVAFLWKRLRAPRPFAGGGGATPAELAQPA